MISHEVIQEILAIKPLTAFNQPYLIFNPEDWKFCKISVVTVHGRFQPPLHINHWLYLSHAFQLADKVIILITNPHGHEPSVPEVSHRHRLEDNPFTYGQRVEIFKYFFQTLGISSYKYECKPFDITQENTWGQVLDKTIPNFINTYSAWSQAKLEKFKKLGFPVIHSNCPKVVQTSGTRIREILKETISDVEKKTRLIQAGYMEEALEGLFHVLHP